MTNLATTTREAGPVHISVRCNVHEVVERFEWLLGDFPGAGETEPSMVAEIHAGDTGYDLMVDGVWISRNRTLVETEDRLTRALNRRVLDEQPEILHVHAGAVRRGQTTLLIVGTSGAGKSTLVATLVAEGWAYLSDEQIGVRTDGSLISYPRPITLRRDSWCFFPTVEGVPSVDEISADRVEVPASAFGTIDEAPPSSATVVVVPDAAAESTHQEPMSAAALFAVLVADTLDLERAAEDGVTALLAVVGGAAGVHIPGGDLEATLARIETVVASDAAGSPVVDHMARGSSDTHAAGAEAWRFGDGSAVIYDHDGGACAVLDSTGFDAWSELAQPKSRWAMPLAASDFVAELHAAGFLVVGSDK